MSQASLATKASAILQIRHPLVGAIGGVTAALENLKTNPQLSERFLQLALQKFHCVLDQIELETKRK